MNKKNFLYITFAIILGTGLITIPQAGADTYGNANIPAATRNIAAVKPAVQQLRTYILVDPVDMVNCPEKYMNKYVKFRAKFDKFATLGLDYKPAFRSSEKFISFLIQRGNVTTHNIPLSELKIFLDRKEAEKHIDLDSGDEVEVAGHVFSNALGDVWMDAEQFVVLTKKPSTSAKK